MKAEKDQRPSTKPTVSAWLLLLVFLLLSLGIAITTRLDYLRQKKAEYAKQTAQLQAIADLKVSEIRRWLDERLGDARLITKDRERTAFLAAFLRGLPQAAAGAGSIRGWMAALRDTYHYENVFLLDEQGGIALAAESHHAALGREGMLTLAASRELREAVLSDLHSNPQMPHVHMGVMAPLLSADKVVGSVLLRIDPGKFLFPLIQSWPTPSPSAETLLVRRDGNHVLFLNELRHRRGTAMKLRLPLSRADLPAVQAVMGRTGILKGRDYRGVPVWTAVQPVPGTTWFMVAKVDEAEILTPLGRRARQNAVLALALILATGALVLMLWRVQTYRFHLHQLEAESERQALVKHFDYLSRYANDLILLSDVDYNIIEANERAVQAYGYGREELLAMNIRQLRVPGEREALDGHYRQAREHDGIIFETLHQRRDGSTFPVEVSARIIQFGGRDYFQSIYRDISERRMAEGKLKEQHGLLRIAGEMARFGGWSVNLEENRAHWSDEVAAIHDMPPGYSPLVEEGIGFYAPEWRERITKVFSACAQQGIPYDEEMEIITARGKRRWVQTLGEAVRDDTGKIVKVQGAFQDISERKKAERNLQRMAERNRALLDAIPDIIMEVDAHKVYTWANHAGIEFFGADVIGSKAAHYFEGEQDTNQAVKPLFDGEKNFLYIESWQRRRDGEKRLLAWWCRVLKDAAGNVTGALSSARDITEIKRSENVLLELTQQLQVRNRIAEVALTVSDENFYHEVLAISLQVTGSRFGVFGYLDEEGDLVVPTMTREIWDQCQVREKDIVFPRCQWGDSIWPTSLRQKRTLHSNEPSVNIPAGHVPVRRNISLPILHGGEPIGLFQVANKETDYSPDDLRTMETIAEFIAPLLNARLQRDRNESLRIKAEEGIRLLNAELEQRVAQRTAQLEAANRELEAFSYSVSHDLRAPLRALAGFSKILEEENAGRLDGEGRRILGVIAGNTSKMGRLIDDLLAFSRLSRQAIQIAGIDLAALAREVFAELRSQEKGRKMEIKIGKPPPAAGDRAMLRQVLQNLLANAVKFTRPRRIARIEFGGRAEKTENVYFVKDNGAGFDPQYGHKLFGVFQRLHASSEFEGTGVGLAIVQRIILRHGGRVWAESSTKGATFYFSLPAETSRKIQIKTAME